jgi:hypothetical protein
LDQLPYLKDHQINGPCLMPAAGMLVMAIEAVRQFYVDREAAASGYKIKDVAFTKAITLSGDPRGTEIQLTLRPNSSQTTLGVVWDHFSLYVYEDGRWHLCCAGSIAIEYDDARHLIEKQQNHLKSVQECRSAIDSSEIYKAFDSAGLAHGPTFRGMRDVKWDQHSQAAGTIGLNDWESHTSLRSDEHFIHPAALVDKQELCFYGDLETSTIGRSGPSVDAKESPKSLYRIDWQPADFDQLPARPIASIPANSCVHIVHDESSSKQVQIVRCIHGTMSRDGTDAVLVPRASVMEHELANTIYIFLPGLDGDLLRNMQQDDLEKMKRLVSTVDALIWVTFQHDAIDQSPT